MFGGQKSFFVSRCESLLGDLLNDVIDLPIEKIKFDDMVNIILVHSANTSGIIFLISFYALHVS
jgi:hypothetical protein